MYTYTNPEFETLVNDFEDEYHHATDDTNNVDIDLIHEIRSLKRKYRDFREYCHAKEVYIKYTKDLIKKYGGKKRFKLLYTIGMVKDYVPFCPKLVKSKKNRKYIKGGLDLDDRIETGDEIEWNPAPVEYEVVFKNTKGKLMGKLFKKDDIKEKISNDLDIIRKFLGGKTRKPTHLSKKAQKRRLLAEKYQADQEDRTFTEKYKDYLHKKDYYIYEEDEDKDGSIIYYKNAMLSKKDAEEIEVYEALNNIGIHLDKTSFSKRSMKVVKRTTEFLGKKGKKKKKKKDKKQGKGILRDKYIDKFTNGDYHTFKEYEKEMLQMSMGVME